MELDLQRRGLVTVSGWRRRGRTSGRQHLLVKTKTKSARRNAAETPSSSRAEPSWPLTSQLLIILKQNNTGRNRVGSVYALVPTCFQWDHMHLILILQIHNTCCFDRIHWIWIIKVSKDTKCVSSNLEGMWKMRRGDKTCFLHCESAERSFKVELFHFITSLGLRWSRRGGGEEMAPSWLQILELHEGVPSAHWA